MSAVPPRASESLRRRELSQRATCDHLHRNKAARYSITSSARPSNARGTVTPSALALHSARVFATTIALPLGRPKYFSTIT